MTNNMEILLAPSEEVKKTESEMTSEKELSTEQIEQIMAKVQDINEKGTAYHSLDWRSNPNEFNGSVLRDVLKFGLLGGNYGHIEYSDKELDELRRLSKEKAWVKDVRKHKIAEVFFNIVGKNELSSINDEREGDGRQRINEIEHSMYIHGKPSVIITFDTSHLTQDYSKRAPKNQPKKMHTFKSKSFGHEDLPNEQPHSEYGFSTSFRVAPKFFKGIIVKEWGFNPKVISGLLEKSGRDHSYSTYEMKEKQKILKNLFNEVKKEMLSQYKDNPKQLLPVYDMYGNLLYPKEMSYEEVKNFVTERDKGEKK